MNRIARQVTRCVPAALLSAFAIQNFARAAEVAVVSAADSASVERFAVQDLIVALNRLYPNDRFISATDLPKTGPAFVVGSLTNTVVRSLVEGQGPSAPESYEIRRVNRAQGELGLIVGADPRGTAYGVYALLRALGCGFFLSGDTFPAAHTNAFSFEGWSLTNSPLVRDRLVFNWHNFLSGCSTWNLEDWQSWTRQSQKMGFNAIMVHAYGNNPMAGFTFNGKRKPLGFLSTTVKGRDWSTMHVNDVRRLWGGEVFTAPAFGSEAGLVPDDQRGEAAQQLMRGVFDYAGQRAMDVYFALDVDTVSANPQELILTLPEGARFSINASPDAPLDRSDGKFWLANPDTREGIRFYEAQLDALLKAYPNIKCLVVWFRNQSTPWMGFKVSEMPARWQEEYRAEIEQSPAAAKYWRSHNIFALGKVVSAFERALRDAGRSDVQLALGTWRFDFLPAADRFLPRRIKLIGLDYDVLTDRSVLRDVESRGGLREAGAHRPVIPVVWAQHDDGHYLGRPYTPFTDFRSRLADANAAGFGIIHWTTRPLDLFFTSLIDQVWLGSRDKPLRATCDDAAERLFGRAARGPMGEYLERWLTGAPQFGRATGNFVFDRPLKDVEGIVAGCRERLKLIAAMPTAGLTVAQRERVAYFDDLEKLMIAFHETQAAFEHSRTRFAQGDLAGARSALRQCGPERVIEQFARLSSLGGITRGEQGFVVSLNTRWLPHVIRLRQALGEEAVRVNFAPTQHESLAQSAGKFTFHFSPDRKVWECWGKQETGADVFSVPAQVEVATQENVPASWKEIARTGMESDKPIAFTLRPMMAMDNRNRGDALSLPAGDYQLRLLFLDPISTAPDQRVFDVSINRASAKSPGAAATSSHSIDRLDIFGRAGGANRLIECRYPVTLEQPGAVAVTLTPVKGKALIAGAVLEPISGTGNARPDPSAIDAAGDDVCSAAGIAGLLRKVNAWQLAHPWKPADRNWIRATYYTGVMAAYAATRDEAFLKQALAWAEENRWQPGDERVGGNVLTCGQTYLELYFLKTNRAFIEPLMAWLDSGASNTPSGAKVWYLEGGRRYADSLYVGPPTLAMLARATGERKYLDWMNAFYWDVQGELLDRDDALFYRDARFKEMKSRNGRKVIWSRGNGWVFAGLPRILQVLPKDDPDRAKYEALFRHMASPLAKRQGGDGLWRSNLDDADEFPGPESSGTGFFCCGFAWGVRTGLLDRDTYLPIVRKAWAGLVRCVSDEGKVQWGQSVGDRPVAVARESSHEYVTGTFLLAGSEVLRLVQNGILRPEPESASAKDTFDLARIRREANAYAEALLIPGQPYGAYRHPRDTNSTLYASCDVALMRAILGEDLRHSLTPAQRADWISHINSFARADGTYGPTLGTHSPEHANGMVIGALGALGGRQKHPVRLYDAFESLEEIEPWLEKMNWRNLWGGSHLFWGGLHCFSFSRRCTPEWREKVLAWLDRNVDSRTGWWRAGVAQGRPGIDGLGGGAHIWPIYQHHGHRFPQPERVIDSILAMQKPDGSWLDYGGYLELDALYGLAYQRLLAPGYRQNNILRAARRHGRGLVERWPGFLERKPNLHMLLAATGSFGLLQQLLPAEYGDSVRWTDIFSDPQLYRTRSVEVLE